MSLSIIKYSYPKIITSYLSHLPQKHTSNLPQSLPQGLPQSSTSELTSNSYLRPTSKYTSELTSKYTSELTSELTSVLNSCSYLYRYPKPKYKTHEKNMFVNCYKFRKIIINNLYSFNWSPSTIHFKACFSLTSFALQHSQIEFMSSLICRPVSNLEFLYNVCSIVIMP